MKETIRCCISCIFPCGAFDVIRVVHASGHVEELPGPATAGDIIKAHPKHVLKRQPSYDAITATSALDLVLPPDAALKRGKIYFLVPLQNSSSSRKREKKKKSTKVVELENGKLGDNGHAEIVMEEVGESGRRSRVGWRPKLQRIQEFDG